MSLYFVYKDFIYNNYNEEEVLPKKLKLNLDELKVKSFQTGETNSGGGFTDDGKCVMLSLHPIICATNNIQCFTNVKCGFSKLYEFCDTRTEL